MGAREWEGCGWSGCDISTVRTVSTRVALVVVVCTAPKENRSGVLVSHVHYRGLSTTRFSRNHEWSRS